MSGEITVEEALDALVDEKEEQIATEADQNLPRLEFGIREFEEVSKFGGLSSSEEIQRYDKWKVDEALTELRSAVGSWTEEKDYNIEDNTTEVFDEPIDEQLIANLEGEIDINGKEIIFGFYGGRRSTRTLYPNPVTFTDDAGKAITVSYDGFDGSMTEEYRELNAITEAVLSNYGRIVKDEPDCL